MGRIKTKLIKRLTKDIFKEHEDELTENFSENKEKIEKYAEFPSKKLRNVVSGYATRMVKEKETI
ncbi:MAG: 30S ribosomal protein S17e [Candidatus Woesearchaeota archaeon]